MSDKPKLNLQFPYFKGMSDDFGLNRDKRAHAAWYYAVLAQKNFASVGKGPESQILVVSAEYNDALWLDKHYEQIARSVALLYGLSSPDDFWNYKDHVIEVGLAYGMEFSPEIWLPRKLIGLNS